MKKNKDTYPVKPTSIKKLNNPARFFLEKGLLWKINRDFLHPLGLALEVKISETGEVEFGDVWDYRDDPDGILFNKENMQSGLESWLEFKRLYVDRKHNTRNQALGFVIQPLEEKEEKEIKT